MRELIEVNIDNSDWEPIELDRETSDMLYDLAEEEDLPLEEVTQSYINEILTHAIEMEKNKLTANYERVKEFTQTFNHFYQEEFNPEALNYELVKLRYKLIQEEAEEFIDGFYNNDPVEILDALTDTQYVLDGAYLMYGVKKDDDIPEGSQIESLTETMKSHPILCMSILLYQNTLLFGSYVNNEEKLEKDSVIELLHIMQRALDVMWEDHYYQLAPIREACEIEVHRSNMSKLGEDGLPVYREDGKIMKGPNFSEPDLALIFLELVNSEEFQIHIPTDEEDEQINRGISLDPDNPELTDEVLDMMKPFENPEEFIESMEDVPQEFKETLDKMVEDGSM